MVKCKHSPASPPASRPLAKVPNTFFAELLPAIDDLAELKVTLYCLWLLNHKQGDLRYTRLAEIAADDRFMAGLGGAADAQVNAPCASGLERAEARGVLLRVKVRQSSGDEDWYFLNSEHGRARGRAHPARRSLHSWPSRCLTTSACRHSGRTSSSFTSRTSA